MQRQRQGIGRHAPHPAPTGRPEGLSVLEQKALIGPSGAKKRRPRPKNCPPTQELSNCANEAKTDKRVVRPARPRWPCAPCRDPVAATQFARAAVRYALRFLLFCRRDSVRLFCRQGTRQVAMDINCGARHMVRTGRGGRGCLGSAAGQAGATYQAGGGGLGGMHQGGLTHKNQHVACLDQGRSLRPNSSSRAWPSTGVARAS